MKADKHTQGKIELKRAKKGSYEYQFQILSDSGEYLVCWTPRRWEDLSSKDKGRHIANAKRLVHCWNNMEELKP